MKTIAGLAALVIAFTTSCVLGQNDKTLITVALPGGAEADYYKCELGGDLNALCRFIEDYARTAATVGDDFLVIYPKDSPDNCLNFTALNAAGAYHIELPADDALDIWMRDFGTIFPYSSNFGGKSIKFKYRPSYLTSYDAQVTSDKFRRFLSTALSRLPLRQRSYPRSSLALDGGNVVDTDHKAIITWRVWEENWWTRTEIIEEINYWAPTNDFQLCMLPNKPSDFDTTGHSDGWVAFLEDDTLVVADYGLGYFDSIWNTVRSCFPGINLVRLESYDYREDSPFPRIDGCEDHHNFASATGSTINLLASKKGLYVPTFLSRGLDNSDQVDVIRDAIGGRKRVVTVDTGMLSHMGGNVRCLSWQVAGDSSIANALKMWANSQTK